jgi:cytochrome oxidase Cu insertion factor (SCO1/SenC/PrrC family)
VTEPSTLNIAEPPAKAGSDRLVVLAILTLAIVAAAGSWAAVVALKHHEKPTDVIPENQRQLVEFSLTDRTGRNITRNDVAGKFLVVDFLFTSCSLTCPIVNRHMAQFQKLTADQRDVMLVSLTVDPRDDTVPVLAKYGERFGADTNRWLLLTGEKGSLYQLISTSFLAQGDPDPFNYMPGNFVHTERIALVDPSGHVRTYFDGLQDDVAEKISGEIARLRNK